MNPRIMKELEGVAATYGVKGYQATLDWLAKKWDSTPRSKRRAWLDGLVKKLKKEADDAGFATLEESTKTKHSFKIVKDD